MKDAVTVILECLGEDVKREGLVDTPKRVAHALEFLTRGNFASPAGTISCYEWQRESARLWVRVCSVLGASTKSCVGIARTCQML